MTKQDFIKLADFIRAYNSYPLVGPLDTPFDESHINALADFFARTYPAFKRDRWTGYIRRLNGPNGGGVKVQGGQP